MSPINRCFASSLAFVFTVFLLGACSGKVLNVAEPTSNLQAAEVTVCQLEEEPALFNGRLVTFEAEAHALTKGRVELWSIVPCPYDKIRSEPSTLPEMETGQFDGLNLYMVMEEGRKVVNIQVVGIAESVLDARKTMYGPRTFKHANIHPVTVKQISETRDREIPAFPPPVQ